MCLQHIVMCKWIYLNMLWHISKSTASYVKAASVILWQPRKLNDFRDPPYRLEMSSTTGSWKQAKSRPWHYSGKYYCNLQINQVWNHLMFNLFSNCGWTKWDFAWVCLSVLRPVLTTISRWNSDRSTFCPLLPSRAI